VQDDLEQILSGVTPRRAVWDRHSAFDDATVGLDDVDELRVPWSVEVNARYDLFCLTANIGSARPYDCQSAAPSWRRARYNRVFTANKDGRQSA
jgi:hypothetical protein